MSTITVDDSQGNTEPVSNTGRTIILPAMREYKRVRRMQLRCFNCDTVTQRAVQTMLCCPACGARVLILDPGKPHRKAKVINETQTETSQAAD